MTDAVIIGSGAGGAPLALKLSQAGFHVLVLEKGPRFGRGGYEHDEVGLGIRSGGFLPSLRDEPHVLVDRSAQDGAPHLSMHGWIACCVGGGTSHMGGALYRFHPGDFAAASTLGAYEELADWPYSYDDLEPYYSEAESLIGVSGLAGANPFEGTRSRPYPMPPLAHHPLTPAFDRTCRELGLHPFPTPRAVNSRPYRGRPACSYCNLCSGFGCPTGARGGTEEAILPAAEATGRCEVRPESMVREITTDARGRATGCIYLDRDGTEHRVEASIVCVCCSAVESARLLLLSTSALFPDGLANGSGLVGRHLQMHAGSTGRARFTHARHPDKLLWDGHPLLQRSLMDHYFLPSGVAPLRKGGIHRFDFTPFWPIRNARQAAFGGSGGALWGQPLKARLREYFHESRGVDFEVFHDFIPNHGTFVELDAQVKDKWGHPVARIFHSAPEQHRAAGRWLVARGLDVLDALGADELHEAGCGYTNWVMTHGTCRAGHDPRTSVLNAFCRAHEVPNLFVVDGSFMPTSGGAPSTLTIVANSLRTADFIVTRASTGEFA